MPGSKLSAMSRAILAALSPPRNSSAVEDLSASLTALVQRLQ
jgi:hypothetical protein